MEVSINDFKIEMVSDDQNVITTKSGVRLAFVETRLDDKRICQDCWFNNNGVRMCISLNDAPCCRRKDQRNGIFVKEEIFKNKQSNVDIKRIHKTSNKIRNEVRLFNNGEKATKQEKDELVKMLHSLGRLTDEEYKDYLNDHKNIDILRIILAASSAILLDYLLYEFLKEKN